MKWIFGLIFLPIAVALLVSCSHKAPATRQDRDKWNQSALKGIYDTSGSRNSKWDKDAEEALSAYAKSRTASSDEATMYAGLAGDSAQNAVNDGCNDAMVGYLYVRYCSDVRAKPLKDRQKLYESAANTLQNSSYPAIWKLYANVDAAELLWLNRNDAFWDRVCQLRFNAISDLAQAAQEKSLPEAEAYDAANDLFRLLQYNVGQMTNAYNQVESGIANQPDKAVVADFIKATFYIEYAWQARGNDTADKVTEEGWRLFKERLDVAQKALEHAWSLDPQDPQIPTLMISVILGEQTGRPEMEKWFARAMKVDSNNYAACRAKLHFLLPQWYGSRDDMLEFGRQCVASTNWGGHVPLILVNAHSEFYGTLSADDRRDYWFLPDVWPDIQAGYEKFAQLNPNESRFRYPYARYALLCLQTNDFVKQINLIRQNDSDFNYNYFGGKQVFDREWAFATGTPVPTNGAATGH